jgi:hypothetical protein
MDDLEIFIGLSLQTKLLRVVGNTIVPTNLNISLGVERMSEDATEADMELALTKWRWWLENIVSKSIAFSKDNDAAMDIIIDDNGVNRTGNLLFVTPGEPSDEMLGSLIQAKFNALGKGHLGVGTIEVTSDNLHGLSFVLVGNHREALPQTIEDYLGAKSYWEVPWWDRDDSCSVDVLKPEDADEDAPPPAWAYSLDFLDRNSPQNVPVKGDTASSRPDGAFQPVIIEGGKKPDGQ